MKIAFLFPGQGAQAVGMGQDIAEAFPEAAHVYEKANDVLGLDLAGLCFSGPAEQLNTTALSQPAIFVTSAAILEVLRAQTELTPAVTAGLSLGEYTALYAAGVLSFADGLRLVHKRGQAMQAAAETNQGAMVSIMNLDKDKVQALCEQAAPGEILQPANFNCPGQIVISGTRDACDRALALAQQTDGAKAVRLEVAGAFHTDLMAPAAEALCTALESCAFHAPASVRVVANTTADYYGSVDDIRPGLVRQLTSAIQWQGCMEKLLADGVEAFYEIGPGRVLTGLMRRIERRANMTNISNLKTLEAILPSNVKEE